MNLEGSVCLVTGAASGIGAAVVAALDAAGAAVVVEIDIQEATPTENAGPSQARHLALAVDVSKPTGMRDAFDRIRRDAGRLDVVFNNAGIYGGAWPDQSAESVVKLATVNLGGVMLGTRLALDAMSGRGGVVVNTASKTGLFAHAESAAYAATKAGIIHFTACCAQLATSHGVRVNAVLPGLTETPMADAIGIPVGGPRGSGPPPLAPARVAEVMVEVARDDTLEPGTYRLADSDTIHGS